MECLVLSGTEVAFSKENPSHGNFLDPHRNHNPNSGIVGDYGFGIFWGKT